MTTFSSTDELASFDFSRRAARLAVALTESQAAAFLVTKPANVTWLTGFAASNMAAAMVDGSLVVATDRRYSEALEQHVESTGVAAEIIVGRDVIRLVTEAVLDAADPGTLGVESHHITWSQQRSLVDLVDDRAELLATEGVVEQLRSVKDAGELARLRRAAAIADHALSVVISELPSVVTEREIARQLEAVMADAGADEPSFATIVAAGPNAARPHAVPSDRPLAPEDLLIIDIGARVDGYGSDMTRTFAVGSFTAQTEDMYRAVEAAQAAGVAAVVAGVGTVEVDAACRNSLTDAGMGDEFTHGTGHGIGLEIHEIPFLSSTGENTPLQAGQVVTVEPGVYRSGVGGVRIEDSVIVTADGCQPITLSPKEPLVAR